MGEAGFRSERLCVVGVGLIGGSLVRALRAAGRCGEVVGYGRGRENLERALALGIVDRIEAELAAAVRGADLVVVAVPVGQMEATFRAMAPHLARGAVVTDVGSTKGSVVVAARRAFGEIPPTFVPGHPIAGTEQKGAEAAFAELFQQRRVILTPLPHTAPDALARVRAMWQAAGAEVEEMGVEHHDEVLAATSHLPHLLAYTLVDSLAQLEEEAEVFRYAAGGFADFTRIASSDPQMWHDICLANRAALLRMLDHFSDNLEGVRRAIEAGDGPYLYEVFRRAKRERDQFCGHRQAVARKEGS